MKLLIITKDFPDNSTGRTYVLWALARFLGWEAKVVSTREGKVWGPVATPEFVDACESIPEGDPRWNSYAAEADLTIAAKPLPGTLGFAHELVGRADRPLLVDIDDPDIEAVLSQGKPLRALAKMVRGGSYWPTRRLVPLVKKYPVMVSNPALQKRYGGVLVPHARVDSGAGSPHTTEEPTIAFVGTNRPHKGVEVLRESARTAGSTAMSLTITDTAPEDAAPNENWVGQTSLSRGVDIVKQSDIVVIPSVRTSAYSAAQLPVKIIDAMLAGRAIVVSDFEPLAWAIGDFGIVVPPGDVASLSLALEELRDPARRADLGDRARERALATFTMPSVASQFAEACRDAVAAAANRGE